MFNLAVLVRYPVFSYFITQINFRLTYLSKLSQRAFTSASGKIIEGTNLWCMEGSAYTRNFRGVVAEDWTTM